MQVTTRRSRYIGVRTRLSHRAVPPKELAGMKTDVQTRRWESLTARGHDCYLEDCQPRFLCTLRSSISKKPLRDVHCCANSYREDAQSNSKEPPIAIGAFSASEFHCPVVDSVGAKQTQSQHAKKRRAHSPKRVNRHLRTPRNKENKGEEKTGGRSGKSSCIKIDKHCLVV